MRHIKSFGGIYLTGIVNINKPIGKSSHFVVAVIRRITGIKKVGHTGTLDPLASGVLPICIGREATKLSQVIMDGDKGYRAWVQLGATTNTQDSEGEIVNEFKTDGITEEKVQNVIKEFVGEISQIPPMYSAIKINGQKLYNLARKGIEVEREPRKVTITSIDLLNFDEQNKAFEIEVSCSKGTYIRTLCADIGEALGCGAYMKTLIRTKCGRFLLKDSITLEKFEELFNKGKADFVLTSPNDFVKSNMKTINFPQDEMKFDASCVALGNFDGVHKGHTKVISRCVEIAKQYNCPSVVYTFKDHPNIILGKEHKNITVNSVKEKMISKLLNPDFLVFHDIDENYLSLSPQEFVTEILVNKLHAKCVVVGEHYSFGKNGAGNAKLLKELCEKVKIKVEILPLLEENGTVISSTSIRTHLTDGDISSASSGLGYHFFISGEVVHGSHIGHTLGFPTINIAPENTQILPQFGVYATKTKIDGEEFEGITNVGIKPTFGSAFPVVETYLFGVDKDFYEKKATVNFYEKIRSEKKFLNADELKKQIKEDVNFAEKYFEEYR